MSKKITSIVKWFDTKKGFGFILDEQGGEDIFVHYRDVMQEGFKNLKTGDQVEFIQTKSDKGFAAVEVSILQV